MHLLNWVLPFNLVVTNVPGPQYPLYLLGARLVDVHPHVPLFPNQGLGIALFSYAGKLCWGFSADRDLVPDLAEFRRCVSASFNELLALARERTRLAMDGGR
jgi:diacylglycerol O-acyltransferase